MLKDASHYQLSELDKKRCELQEESFFIARFHKNMHNLHFLLVSFLMHRMQMSKASSISTELDYYRVKIAFRVKFVY